MQNDNLYKSSILFLQNFSAKENSVYFYVFVKKTISTRLCAAVVEIEIWRVCLEKILIKQWIVKISADCIPWPWLSTLRGYVNFSLAMLLKFVLNECICALTIHLFHCICSCCFAYVYHNSKWNNNKDNKGRIYGIVSNVWCHQNILK